MTAVPGPRVSPVKHPDFGGGTRMSTAVQPVREVPLAPRVAPQRRIRKRKWLRALILMLLVFACAGGVAWYAIRAYRNITGTKADVIPTAKVLRGDVTLAVTARGELRGGNPEVLTAPLTGGLDMHLTTLAYWRSGEKRRCRARSSTPPNRSTNLKRRSRSGGSGAAYRAGSGAARGAGRRGPLRAFKSRKPMSAGGTGRHEESAAARH